jgi:toxin ParE1/3/4
MGRPRPELRPDVRSFPSGHYIIFFRYLGEILEVIKVLEGHRDVQAFFREEER